MQDAATKIVGLIYDNSRIVLIALVGFLVIGAVAAVSRTHVLRQAFRKFYYLARNVFSADLGWRDLVYWLTTGAFVALPVALWRGYGKGSDQRFHWGEFEIWSRVVDRTPRSWLSLDGPGP